MRYDDTRLRPDEVKYVGRLVEMELRTTPRITSAEVQRVLEDAARQSNDSLWKRAAFGSDAQCSRIVREARANRQERAISPPQVAAIVATLVRHGWTDVTVRLDIPYGTRAWVVRGKAHAGQALLETSIFAQVYGRRFLGGGVLAVGTDRKIRTWRDLRIAASTYSI